MLDDLNWGTDKRFMPKVVRVIQKVTQITWLKHFEPPTLTVAIFPPCIFASIPLPLKPQKLPDAEIPVRPSMHIRLGWRRDMNSGEFYLSAACKKMDRVRLW